MLSEQLYQTCEEFFDLISTEHRTDEVMEIVESTTEYLLDDIDGRTHREDNIVAEEVETQIKNLWALLPPEERRENNNLRDYYDDIITTVSDVLDGNQPGLADGECDDEYGEDYDEDNLDDEEDYE